jgi:hypothetical protein
MTDPFRVYIGWDRREPEAYEVAKFSVERLASVPVAVTPIKLDELSAKGLYRKGYRSPGVDGIHLFAVFNAGARRILRRPRQIIENAADASWCCRA